MEILTSKRVKHQIIKIVGDLFPFNQLTASLLWPHLSQSESSSDVWDSLKFVVTWCIFIQACCLHQWLSRQKVIQNQRHFCPIFNFLIFFFSTKLMLVDNQLQKTWSWWFSVWYSPDMQRLAVNCRWWWSLTDLCPRCWGLWCSFPGHKHNAHETTCV